MVRSYSFLLLILALTAVFFSSVVTVTAAEDATPVSTEGADVVEEEDLKVSDEEDEEEEETEDAYDDEEADLEYVVIPSPDVGVKALFPAYPDNVLEIGVETTLLVVLSNTGDNTFNMTKVGAYLQSNYDLTYFIQNYTTSEPDVILEAGEQVTLSYKFTPHERLEPETFHFSAYAQYNDTADDTVYETTFFNSSIVLIDQPTPFDVKGALSYVAVIVAFVATFLYFKQSGSSKSDRVESGSSQKSQGSSADWGEAYVPSSAAKRRNKKM